MSRYWNPRVRQLSPYVPGEQPKTGDPIKLNTNESPYGPSPAVLEALRAAVDDSLRLYPDPENTRLRETWGRTLGLRPDQVFPGNGSDEVLAHCFRALFREDRPVLFPDITYSFYPVFCGLFGLECRRIPLTDDFEIRLSDYGEDNGGIVFPNPNAPTGMALALEAIRELLERNRNTVVVVDEAYIDFGGESAVPLVAEYRNLLVIRTLSKSRALAGLRVGAAFGDEALISGLTRVGNSFNSYPLDRLAEAGAIAALEDEVWFEQIRRRLIASRDSLAGSLGELGFRVLPSAANFVFVRHESRSATELREALRERGIVVRHFRQPRIENFLRISVGTEEECDALVGALTEILARGAG